MLAYALMLVVAQPVGEGNAKVQVLATLDKQAAAWNRGDLEGFTAAYADDAVFVSPSGITNGRADVLARYKRKYPDKKAMGTLKLTPVDLREAVGAVSVAAKWELTFADKATPPSSGSTVVVLQKLRGEWRIVHDASM